jgi:hypothetical protein
LLPTETILFLNKTQIIIIMRKHLLLLSLFLIGLLHASAQTTVDTTSTCSPMCTGSITINATGGTPPYNYSIDGGITFSTNSTFSGLCLDTFSIVVTDASATTIYTGTANTTPQGCQQLSTPLSYNYNIMANDSFGIFNIMHCTGVVSFTVSGGVPPYMLALENISTGALTPFQSSTVFDSLCTGYYYLHIQDAVGSQFCYCYNPAPIYIPRECNVPTYAYSNYDCVNNNTAFLNAYSMDMNAMYLWSSSTLSISPPNSASTIAYGAPGTHTATVDIFSNGCPGSQYVLTITLCTPITLDNVTNSNGQLCAQVGSNVPAVNVTWYEGSNFVANGNCIPVPSSTTVYSIIIDNPCGCSDTMSYTYQPVSVGEINENAITVYPNPSTGKLLIKGDIMRITRITISDPEGRSIITVNGLHTNELDIEGLANGIYFISAENASGTFFRQRIVKAGK